MAASDNRSRNPAGRPSPATLSVGERIAVANMRSLRVQAGLSQAAVAKALGVTFQHVSHLEKGRTRVYVDTLFELALLFGVPVAEFFRPVEHLLPDEVEAGPAVRVYAAHTVELTTAFLAIEDAALERALIALCRAAADAGDADLGAVCE
jgi:transcriptional regulator with XRE-family HTH domain